MRTSQLPPREAYIADLFAKHDSVFDQIDESLLRDQKFGMKISPVEGKLLYFLMKAFNCAKIVEIGTLYGYSALWMARALPADGRLYTFEFDENHSKQARQFFDSTPLGKKIELLTGPAIENLKNIESQGPFDAVFIDADKGGYPGYLTWAEKNVRKGGLIIGDNTFLFGGVYDPKTEESPGRVKAMREFNQRLADESKYLSILLPTSEGMTIAQKLY